MVCFFTYLTNVDCVFRKHWIYCPWLCICGKIFVPFVTNITLKISHVSNIFFKGHEIKKWLYPLKKLNVKYILRWPSVPKGVLLLFLSDRLVKPPRYLTGSVLIQQLVTEFPGTCLAYTTEPWSSHGNVLGRFIQLLL